MDGVGHESAVEASLAAEQPPRTPLEVDGVIVEDGPPEQVLDAPCEPRTQKFLCAVVHGEEV
jgi:ABC-type histidine transport system ATPase subunit